MKVLAYTTKLLFGDDATSDTGARRLKQGIECYWRDRGYAVHVELRRMPYSGTMRSATFAVVSDMVNGLPRDALKQKQGRAIT